MKIMPNLLSITAAIHGDQPKFTTTVVGGDRKNNIRMIGTWSESIDLRSEQSVRTVLDTYLTHIGDVLRRQRAETDQVPVPVVFGWPIAFTPGALIRNMHKAFGDLVPEPRVTKKDRNARRERGSRELTAAERNRESQSKMHLIGDLVRAHCTRVLRMPNAATFKPRVFTDNYAAMGVTDPAVEDRVRQRDLAWELVYMDLLECATAGDAVAMRALEQKVREAAEEMAYSVAVAGLHGPGQNRFMLTGLPRPPFTENLRLNCFVPLHLREVFARELIRILGYTYNIAVKAPVDPPSKPFADVGATYIGDDLDRLAGRHDPTVVIVQHDAPTA